MPPEYLNHVLMVNGDDPRFVALLYGMWTRSSTPSKVIALPNRPGPGTACRTKPSLPLGEASSVVLKFEWNGSRNSAPATLTALVAWMRDE
ncbi:hypothetical protein GCM10009779_44200 [Polymorphospora rubra]|uniref:Uncharacterized protein n=1 Tax=Polymorphospora rubra TaxID=338584 RepID=A0A810N9Q9_9ACTN|nr:hypothetical protein Prubr_51160 [Polymorphospora rubra]